MAIHDATGGGGEDLWLKWSAKSAKHNDADMGKKWHSFGKSANPVTIGTLIYLAQNNGWSMPMGFRPDWENPEEPEIIPDGMPFDISNIDLTCPPGMVGDLTKWIESQSRRPRKKLSVAAAIVSMGNVCGLRFIDARDGVTGNIFAFCIAGSRTGKESINQAVAAIHQAAGISAATHGMMKSEQEVIKNLTRHQAAFYVVDEIGLFLKKVKNAQKKGGTPYLEGLIGILLSAYSKADGYLLITGDAKEDARKNLTNELAQTNRQLDEKPENKWAEKRAESIVKTLASLDDGLKNPFLSIIGFTTPVTFDDVIDYENATNGFIGRSLLFNERDTAPRSKSTSGFSKDPLPLGLELAIKAIALVGDDDLGANPRVEFHGDRVRIETDAKASEMLEAALIWFEDQAVTHKDATGLEALYLGGYELVAKVSFILSVPERLRTAEHVRWAFALVKEDVEEKLKLVTANDREKDNPKLAMIAKIGALCGRGEGITLGTLHNRMRGKRKEDVNDVIDSMVERKLLEREEVVHATNKTRSVRLRYIGRG